MSIFSIFNKNNSKQLTVLERCGIDSESCNNPNYKPPIGETQCYNCTYMNKSNTLKCPKVGDVSKEILKDEKNANIGKKKINIYIEIIF